MPFPLALEHRLSFSEKAQFLGLLDPEADSELAAQYFSSTPGIRMFPSIGVVAGYLDRDGISAAVEKLSIINVDELPEAFLIEGTDLIPLTSYPVRWGQEAAKLDILVDVNAQGEGVKVAVLDTGVDAQHPCLRHAIRGFAKFDRNGIRQIGADPEDTWGHGTHVCGLIAGSITNREYLGAAPNSELYVANVVGSGSQLKLLAALDWAVSSGCKVINISMGSNKYSKSQEDLFTRLLEKNISIIAAVGNDGPSQATTPAIYPSVISVGAVGIDLNEWDESGSLVVQRDKDSIQPDILAPGVSIYSSLPMQQYGRKSGTSQAAPIVSGIVAALRGAFPDVSAKEIKDIIQKTSHKENDPISYRAEHGIIDAEKAFLQISSI